MTYSKAIGELIVAVGYALDAGDERKDSERRRKAREKAEDILTKIVLEDLEIDPIIIAAEDIKKIIAKRIR